MTNTEWKFIPGEEHYLSHIRALSEAAFGMSFDEDHLRWRYFQNPLGPAAITMAYEPDNDRVVGFYAAVPATISLGQTQFRGAQSLDTMVHPDYQGQGMFTKLATKTFEAMTEQGFDMIYGFPNQNSFGGFVRRLKWVHTGNIPVWVRPMHPALKWLPKSGTRKMLHNDTPTASALDALHSQLSSTKYNNRIHRDGAWLHWRYDARGLRHNQPNSLRAYHWICSYDEAGQLDGYCVWGILDSGPSANLCELYATHPKTASALLGEAIRQAQQTPVKLFRVYAQSDALKPLLWRNAFIPAPAKYHLPFIVHPFQDKSELNVINTHAQWEIMGGDMDWQ